MSKEKPIRLNMKSARQIAIEERVKLITAPYQPKVIETKVENGVVVKVYEAR